MDLAEVKKSAEQVLAGVESDDWRGLAQQQARTVLGIVDAIAEGEAKYAALASGINSELAQLKAESGDLEDQKARAKAAEAKAKRLGEHLVALTKERDQLKNAVAVVKSAAESVQAAGHQVEAALKGN
jgi:chromosome segregation ATPase